MSIKYLSSFLCLVVNFYLVHGQVIKTCETYPAGNKRDKGTCVPIQDCPRIKALLNDPGQAGAVTTLRRSICSLNPPTVCCEPAERDLNELVLPTDCGNTKKLDFIVGGQDASWWPWIVLLFGRFRSGRSTFYCGGNLINDRFFLTAAHCIAPEVTIEYARVGELKISTNPDTYESRTAPPVQDIPVAYVIIHPQYGNPCSTCNDIAIYRLIEPVQMHEGFVTPICLPLNPKQDLDLTISQFQGQTVKAAGWGTTIVFDPTSQPDHLQEVDLTIATRRFCRQHTPRHPTGSVICAGFGNGKDTCKGDSGGPLMLTNEIGTRYFLLGITSFGPRACGGPGTQGVYTSVHHYLPWIQRNIS